MITGEELCTDSVIHRKEVSIHLVQHLTKLMHADGELNCRLKGSRQGCTLLGMVVGLFVDMRKQFESPLSMTAKNNPDELKWLYYYFRLCCVDLPIEYSLWCWMFAVIYIIDMRSS